MSDPLMDFLLSRDPNRVSAEVVRVPLMDLLAEASAPDRALIDQLPVGVLQRRLLNAERLIASLRSDRAVQQPKARVVGNPELVRAVRVATERARHWEARYRELRDSTQLDGKVSA